MTLSLSELQLTTRRISHWIDVNLELPILYRHISSLHPGQIYLEVGTGPGGCSAIQAALSAQDGVEVWTIDNGEFSCKKFNITLQEYRTKIESWFDKFNVKSRIIFRTEDSVTMPWDNRPIHVLFIDGNHSYESVKADVLKWTPFVPVNGIIIFHDCTTHKSVSKAVNETIGADWEPIESEFEGSLCVFRRIYHPNGSETLA
ncbi:MAG: class I SAM-dependent methyltransferase [Candidatus Thorarchaeota archaeon]|jgi:predicted O-methyltransferase YrrM